jgi:DNA-binding response OmpR family regulator
MLPGRSGIDILRELRATGETLPVLMLTAKGDIVDRVVGLELGADDYLPNRSRSAGDLVLGGVRFDLRSLTATGSHGPVALTCHDILVLKVLADNRGEVVRRIDIVEEVCGLDSEATLRTVDNHIVALRQAIGDDPRRPRWLHTVRGEGYRLALPDNR